MSQIRDVKNLKKSRPATKLSANAKAFFPEKTSSGAKQNPNGASPLFPPPLPYHQQPYIPPVYYHSPCPTPVNPQLQYVQYPQGVGYGRSRFLRPPFYYGPPNPGIMVGQDLPVNPGASLPPQDLLVLRSNIVRQIEYYFSDENLKKDSYLISIMDGQGWVSISTISEFKRLKSMCTDIPFILDSLLLGSTGVEVQGYKIRRRDKWLKWIPAYADSTVTIKQHIQPEQLRSANTPEKIVEVSSDGKDLMDLLLASTGHGTDSVLDGESLVFTADN